MSTVTANATSAHRAPAATALVVGWIVRTDAGGRAIVDYPANPEAPLPAATLVTLPSEELEDARVTLGFLDGDRRRPVITGVLQDALVVPEGREREAGNREGEPIAASVDGRRVAIRAREEITLECGKSSITLRNDGRIVIRGKNLWSRASEVNRIHGANVRIN